MRAERSLRAQFSFADVECGAAWPRLGNILPQFEEAYCTESCLSEVVANRFTFGGETHDCGTSMDWLTNPSADVEWHILLHKFYYAPGLARSFVATRDERYRACFQALVESWISQVPIGFIATDVTARRVQNWIYAWFLFARSGASFSAEFSDLFFDAVVRQVDHVIEFMAPARNHRTLELYAVFLAATAFPDLPAAAGWRDLARREMLRNISTDLLDDGVHCELSTDYHHIVLRSYLLFVRLSQMNGIEVPPPCARRICRALDFAMHVHRPDGLIPALSDSDSRDFRELLSWGSELFGRADYAWVASAGGRGRPPAITNRIFDTSGYAILRSPWVSNEPYADARYLVFDVGPIGAGNHGHLDALNIEVAAYGRPLVIDPGRYTYHEGGDYNWRAHFRETRAHNTVLVDGENQAIYRQKGGRRKIYHPQPHAELVEARLTGRVPYLCGRVISPNYDAEHEREIWFPDGRYWLVLDRLHAGRVHDYELRFQLSAAADGHVTLRSHPCAVEIQSPGLVLATLAEDSAVNIEDGFVSTTYGEKCSAPRICVSMTSRDALFATLLYPFKTNRPALTLLDQTNRHTLVIEDGERRDFWAFDKAESTVSGHSDTGDWTLATEQQHVQR